MGGGTFIINYTGLYLHEIINCDDNNACIIDSCNATVGWQYFSVVCESKQCYKTNCDKNYGCEYTPMQ